MAKINLEQKRAVVNGAGGFIGHHLVKFLKKKGYWVRGVDIKFPEYGKNEADEFLKLDLRLKDNCLEATRDVNEVYALAADMGGMGYISFHDGLIMYNNSLIDLNTFEAARFNKVDRIFYSSSACVYPEFLQEETEIIPLKEEDAYPAQPQDGYGWQKIMTERLGKYYARDYGMTVRIARFHNIFGPEGTWGGGREKAPAAVCRKVAQAKLTGKKEIEIWGDGLQTRSFCYIDDCTEGIYKLMHSDFTEPLNIGQDRMVTINQLVDMVAKIAGVDLNIKHIKGPQGVRGRNSDNAKLKQVLNWEPKVSLEEGLKQTYQWIETLVKQQQ